MKKTLTALIVLLTIVFSVAISISVFAGVQTLPEFPHHQKIMQKVFRDRVNSFFTRTIPQVFERNALNQLKRIGDTFFLQVGLDVLGKREVEVLEGEGNFRLTFSGRVQNSHEITLAGKKAVVDFYGGNLLKVLKANLYSLEEAILANEILSE